MRILPKKQFFKAEEEQQIIAAIREAELNTSGEIRVHVESRCKGNAFERGLAVFAELEMHKTQLQNGVLFYFATKDHKFAIVADEGINNVVAEDFWENIKQDLQEKFQAKAFAEGLCEAIEAAGKQLKQHFPYQSDDKNELPDDISKGD